MGNCAAKVEEPQESQSPINNPTIYMNSLYGISTCKCLQKWENLTKLILA